MALKKYECVFNSRPGIVLIITTHADKHWSIQWEVIMVLSAAMSAGKKAIDGAFRDIPISSLGKPTLFIATAGTCDTGLDCLQKVSHGILFVVPWLGSHAPTCHPHRLANATLHDHLQARHPCDLLRPLYVARACPECIAMGLLDRFASACSPSHPCPFAASLS